MIRKCNSNDFETIYSIINNAANAYKGVIPNDCWKQPYMSKEELKHEINSGVVFWGYKENNQLVGVMGIQDVKDVTLIRHSYVKTEKQKQGIDGKLLSHLIKLTKSPILIGTWKDAVWAIHFYEKHGFKLVPNKDYLLKKYWSIPECQIKNSIVLANKKWFNRINR